MAIQIDIPDNTRKLTACDVANILEHNLHLLGFDVWRYDAPASVYLKPDDGVLGSIRVSTHRGVTDERYAYAFNLLKKQTRYETTAQIGANIVTRRYYAWTREDVILCLQKLVAMRQSSIHNNGEKAYADRRAYYRTLGMSHRRGFWHSSQLHESSIELKAADEHVQELMALM